MIVVIGNGNVLDPQAGELVGERTVVIEDDRIVDLIEGHYRGSADLEIDAAGRFVLPGLIDAHQSSDSKSCMSVWAISNLTMLEIFSFFFSDAKWVLYSPMADYFPQKSNHMRQ